MEARSAKSGLGSRVVEVDLEPDPQEAVLEPESIGDILVLESTGVNMDPGSSRENLYSGAAGEWDHRD